MKCDHRRIERLGGMSLSSWRAWIEISSTPSALLPTLRRSPHGERGLKSRGIGLILYDAFCRSPHGERGLKLAVRHDRRDRAESLSSWRAWIEMSTSKTSTSPTRRSPHGERGLKSVSASFWPPRGCCSPCLCPVFPAHAGFHMCGTASNGKPGFLSARGDFNGNTSRNCDWVFRMGSLLKAM